MKVKVLKMVVLVAVLASVFASPLMAKSDTITLHLRATVPARASVEVMDNNVSVGFNDSNVDFAAYDNAGALLSNDMAFAGEAGMVTLAFTSRA